MTNLKTVNIFDGPSEQLSEGCDVFALHYPAGPLGVVGDGAYGDIILVGGNPLNDVSVLGDNGKNIPLDIKDVRICRNKLWSQQGCAT